MSAGPFLSAPPGPLSADAALPQALHGTGFFPLRPSIAWHLPGRGLLPPGPFTTMGGAMSKEPYDLKAMSREKLDDLQAIVEAKRQQKEEELRDCPPPKHFTQLEINAAKEQISKETEALSAYESEIGKEIFAQILGRRRL
jgi:hypothetical protein